MGVRRLRCLRASASEESLKVSTDELGLRNKPNCPTLMGQKVGRNIRIRRCEKHRNPVLGPGQPPYQREIVRRGQMGIEEDGVRLQRLNCLDRLILVDGVAGDVEPPGSQKLADHFSKGSIIVDDQDGLAHRGIVTGRF